MKTSHLPQGERHTVRRSFLRVCLFVLVAASPLPALGQANYATRYTFATLAGNVGYGAADGIGSTAWFYYPNAVAVDAAGNVYVADTCNSTIRKVTPTGVVATLAGQPGGYGSADGTGSAARFDCPFGVAVDGAGNVYVADTDNNTIRKVTPAGVVTTLAGQPGGYGSADGTGSAARFNDPFGVAVDGAGNVYVADTGNNTIRKVTSAGAVTTLAGLAGNPGNADGTGTSALFNYPHGVAVDGAGNVYVADTDNYTIRKVTPTGVVTTLAGQPGNYGTHDGTGSAALFGTSGGGPQGVAVDSAGNVYVADSGNNTIRKVTPTGAVTTLAGRAGNYGSADGTGTNAVFYGLAGVAVDGTGNIYVADSGNDTIRKGIPASSVPAPILQPPSLDGGEFAFGITGPPGLAELAVDVEASRDLSQWQWVGTYILEGGTNYFLSPTPPQGAQFYRGRVR